MKHFLLITQAYFIGLLMMVGSMAARAESGSKINAPNMNNKSLSETKDNGMETDDFKTLQKMLQNKTRPITWVFVGDSITHGARHTNGSRSYPEHFAERVRCELERYADIVINAGVTNDTTNVLLNTWEARVTRFKPDVVSIMEGMNDSCDGAVIPVLEGMDGRLIDKKKFANNLHEIIRRVRQIGAIPLLHTMNAINPSADLQRKNLPTYVAVIRAVARNEKVILVDNYKHWQTNTNFCKWLNDAIHPNEVGHRAIADEMFRALSIFDDKSPTCLLPLQK
jgi:lysophospholipase L1-like esterase